MEKFDYDDSRSTDASPAVIWNTLTILALLGVVCIACLTLGIFSNPYLTLNPFPPPNPTSSSAAASEGPVNTMVLPPTWTPTNPPVPTATNPPPPTPTLVLTPTPITLTPTETLTVTEATAVPPGGYPFVMREGSPVAISNIYHPELGCNWMGVGGQVLDMSGGPVTTGMIIQLGGVLPGVRIPENLISLTGVALSYGRSGYEFTLADRPVASRNSLWVQLLNQAGGPLSEKIYFDTYDSCDKNLIIIDFKQVR